MNVTRRGIFAPIEKESLNSQYVPPFVISTVNDKSTASFEDLEQFEKQLDIQFEEKTTEILTESQDLFLNSNQLNIFCQEFKNIVKQIDMCSIINYQRTVNNLPNTWIDFENQTLNSEMKPAEFLKRILEGLYSIANSIDSKKKIEIPVDESSENKQFANATNVIETNLESIQNHLAMANSYIATIKDKEIKSLNGGANEEQVNNPVMNENFLTPYTNLKMGTKVLQKHQGNAKLFKSLVKIEHSPFSVVM